MCLPFNSRDGHTFSIHLYYNPDELLKVDVGGHENEDWVECPYDGGQIFSQSLGRYIEVCVNLIYSH